MRKASEVVSDVDMATHRDPFGSEATELIVADRLAIVERLRAVMDSHISWHEACDQVAAEIQHAAKDQDDD